MGTDGLGKKPSKDICRETERRDRPESDGEQ